MKNPLGERLVPSLLVRDLSASISFYSTLGFEPTGWYPDRESATWAEITCGALVIQLYTQPPRGTPVEPTLSGTFYLFPPSVKQLAEQLEGVVPFEWGPEAMDYGMLEFAVRDPDGYLIAFSESVTDE